VPEIVTEVLRGAGVPFSLAFSRRHATRAYCVQREESDAAFIHRLLAEEGIFYFFAPATPPDLHAMVLADSAAAYPSIPGISTLVLRHTEGGTGADDDVTTFALRRKIQPGAVLVRDYDFKRPSSSCARRPRAPPTPATGSIPRPSASIGTAA